MAFNGVRSSWLMRARNSDLARLARSAVSASRNALSARLRCVTSQFRPTMRAALPFSSRTAWPVLASQCTEPSGQRTSNS